MTIPKRFGICNRQLIQSKTIGSFHFTSSHVNTNVFCNGMFHRLKCKEHVPGGHARSIFTESHEALPTRVNKNVSHNLTKRSLDLSSFSISRFHTSSSNFESDLDKLKKKFEAATKDTESNRVEDTRQFRYRVLSITLALLAIYSIVYFTDFVELFRRFFGKKEEFEAGSSGSTKRAIGKPKIGGAFTLVDAHSGQPITDSKFRGKYMLIYFGFTNCPDICPEEMEKVTRTMDYLENHYPSIADKINIIFVSVDPHRDSLEAISTYLKDFHPKYIGLTGTPLQVKEACRKYRVFYSAPEDATRDGDYAVDHSIYTYLMDEYGELIDYFSQDTTSDEMIDGIISSIRDGRSRFI